MLGTLFLVQILPLGLVAQPDQEVPMADLFRQEGKIYVVVGIVLLLFTGLFTYLYRVESRLKGLETRRKESDEEKNVFAHKDHAHDARHDVEHATQKEPTANDHEHL